MLLTRKRNSLLRLCKTTNIEVNTIKDDSISISKQTSVEQLLKDKLFITDPTFSGIASSHLDKPVTDRGNLKKHGSI
jgi:hypothetical protein